MKLSTKILLSMLTITTGLTLLVSWMVSMNVSAHETDRVNTAIGNEIFRSIRRTGRIQREIQQVVRSALETPENQRLVKAALDPRAADTPEVKLFRDQIIQQGIAKELESLGVPISFVALAAAGTPSTPDSPAVPGKRAIRILDTEPQATRDYLTTARIPWNVKRVISSDTPVSQYVWTPGGLFIALGVPIEVDSQRRQRIACYVGIDVERVWSKQLFDAGANNEVELTAWYEVQNQIVARATSRSIGSTGAVSKVQPDPNFLGSSVQKVKFAGYEIDQIVFHAEGEKYLGQVIGLDLENQLTGRFVIAASLDQALLPLKRLQQEIIIAALLAVVLSLIACRYLTNLIVKPVEDLVAGTQRISQGNYDHPVKIARADELGVLARSFNQMAQGLRERARLLEERFKMVKLEEDLEVARRIQQGLLPATLPPIPGYDLAVFTHPAQRTGGDIYDIVELPPSPNQSTGEALPDAPQGKLPGVLILVADATGHGIGSALSVTQMRSMLRVGIRLSQDLAQVLDTINLQVCQDLEPNRFVTAFVGILDPSTHTLKYLSAGHGPILLYRAKDNSVELLMPTSMPLGISPNVRNEPVRTVRFEPGDRAVLLTDGFHETMNGLGQTFSFDRLLEFVRTRNGETSESWIKALLAEIQKHSEGISQADDRTAVVFRRL
jgi:serine phosphatase RsbU (regulator of sigma subunit)